MKNYTVYFDLYGKKMKAKVLAESNNDAQQKIKEKITFHKVVEDPEDEFNQATDIFNSIMDILDGKK
jgi:hypothetical protein